MKKTIISLTFTIFVLHCFGQSRDTIKYFNAINFIKKDKEIDKFRNKYFFKKSKAFRVSKHIVYNYQPLRHLEKYLDSLGINNAKLDSLCSLQKDTTTVLPFAPKLSADLKSDFLLYFGKSIKNIMLVVIENSKKEFGDRYNGMSNRPFIILLVFDKNNSVRKAYCSAPIFD